MSVTNLTERKRQYRTIKTIRVGDIIESPNPNRKHPVVVERLHWETGGPGAYDDEIKRLCIYARVLTAEGALSDDFDVIVIGEREMLPCFGRKRTRMVPIGYKEVIDHTPRGKELDKFRLHWSDGLVEIAEGESIGDALRRVTRGRPVPASLEKFEILGTAEQSSMFPSGRGAVREGQPVRLLNAIYRDPSVLDCLFSTSLPGLVVHVREIEDAYIGRIPKTFEDTRVVEEVLK